MTDLKLSWGPDGGDLVLDGEDLALDQTPLPAVLVSLFSDARRPASDAVPVLEQDLRGFWGEASGDVYGSLLWTLMRAKATPDTLAMAQQHSKAALEWMVRDGIAARVETRATYVLTGVLQLEIEITRGTSKRWSALWRDAAVLLLRFEGAILQGSALTMKVIA